MTTDDGNITLLEAIETLSAIAELELEDDITVAETGEVLIGERQAIEWLNLKDEEETVAVIRDIFTLLLKYIKGVYEEGTHEGHEELIDGVKTIMVFVGQAAKKLDKFTELFHWAKADRITELPEYRNLQKFYNDQIARQVDSRQLSRWILGLAKQPTPVTRLKGRIKKESKHIYVDLDAVKKDSEYELFYIRKEDGTRFFNPQLIRNMTLVSDFGNVFGGAGINRDPILAIRHWQDWRMRGAAEGVRNYVNPLLSRFYRESKRYHNRELSNILKNAVVALMLACNPRNDIGEDVNRKSCFDYFADFLYFLRAGLASRDYQKLIAYPPKRENKLAFAELDLIHGLCYGLFLLMQGEQNLLGTIQEKVEMADEAFPSEIDKSDLISSWLASDYAAMTKLMKHHPNGPLIKILQSLQQGDYQFFDPLWQHDLPCQLFSLYINDQRISNVRMPCPVHQEFIHKAFLNEEFKGFLRALKDSPVTHRHLIINFQDRTSWKEHARCHAIEEIQNIPDFHDHLAVVTLTKETDFYYQNDPYDAENHAQIFIATFVEHLEDESCGYFFPDWIKEELGSQFFYGIMDGIHRTFFNEKNVLTREQRLDFIEIAYFFIELKLLEIVKPESFSLMCKDGIDVSGSANIFFFIMMKMINQEKLSDQDRDHLRLYLYGPPLAIRERVLIPDRFNRMVGALRVVEVLRQEFGAASFGKILHQTFGKFYKTKLIEGTVVPSHTE